MSVRPRFGVGHFVKTPGDHLCVAIDLHARVYEPVLQFIAACLGGVTQQNNFQKPIRTRQISAEILLRHDGKLGVEG